MLNQCFGGPWTERKLDALERYLNAYLTIFTGNPKAAKFTRYYVDAFAGSGLRAVKNAVKNLEIIPIDFNLNDADETVAYMDGSVRRVLSMGHDFHQYWFIEKDPKHVASLQRMIGEDFANRSERCTVINGDANEFLPAWSDNLGKMDRAVVFLDPYGMNIRWTTIENLAETQKVDLWMLFPSSSVIRMLPKEGPPNEAWAQRLTELFGSESWRHEFYSQMQQEDLFGEYSFIDRRVDERTVANYLLRRLREIFVDVVDRPLVLRNSRNSPLFMLVFAAGNPRGAPVAVKIAKYIIENT